MLSMVATMENIDAYSMQKIVEELSFPRLMGSEGEPKAITILKTDFHK